MKRLIPAVIILVLIIVVCIFSDMYVDHLCNQTLADIEDYKAKALSDDILQLNWKKQKEKMSIFVNHSFLDKISIYIGQLTVSDINNETDSFNIAYKNIQTTLSQIKEEQAFALHSFY